MAGVGRRWDAGGTREGAQRPRRGLPGPGSRGSLIDSRPRDTLYLSSHRCPFAGLTKKEIGFADFDPFVFGQRPAARAGAEKCEGALIGRPGSAPAPRMQPPALRESLPSAVQGRLPSRTPICLGYPSIYKLKRKCRRRLLRTYLLLYFISV